VTLSLKGGDRTIPQLLVDASVAFGHKVAWTDGSLPRSYEELPRVAASGAAFLASIGVKAGDRVMVISENRGEILDLLISCSWLGAVLVPINPATPGPQLDYFLSYTEPNIVFFEKGKSHDVGSHPVRWVELPPVAAATDPKTNAHQWFNSEGIDFQPDIRPSTPLTLLMTSGTTGVSKGVVCPQGQFLAWGESVSAMLGLTKEDVAYTCLPLFHTNALNAVFQCLITGATFHVGPRFSSSRFWERNVEAGSTVTYLLGAMVSMLLNVEPSEAEQAHSISRILAPGTSVSVIDAFENRFGALLVEGHGMTETNAVIGTPFGSRRLGYMGKVMQGFEASVVDENDTEVTDGEPGELVLRSNIPHAFATEYWKLPAVTVAANANQWFHTGDRVVRDDGWFRFLDRIKDVIRRRGENISAWEVEKVLDAHPEVIRSAVVPVPSELGEDEVMAFVITSEGALVEPEVLRRHCAESLPAFAMPRYLEFVDEFPLTDTGKVRKQLLKERGVGESTWDANGDQPVPQPV